MGILEPIDDTSCLLHLGADSPWSLTWMISSLDTDFTVTGPPELIEAVRTLGRRCTAAVTP
ncbi:hypothetical protein F6W96_20525 [Nocardia terpenica]|uniref:WCX domain-containing protein n=2 Tax=Nocardia terpenica TaxID=455432 RepID=A0A6G9Z4B9_9NOCA|nr:hypothetical protein F6W96_20525 [Nocardia terpenica]